MSRFTRATRRSICACSPVVHAVPAESLPVADSTRLVGPGIPAEHEQLRPSIAPAIELLRAWKLITLAAGIGLLIWGSFAMPAPDWDIPISIIMAVVAYVLAPWVMRVLVLRQWRWLPAALVATWFGVDGCYAIYWHFVDPQALALMRDVNAPASLSLFLAVGLFWMPRGSLREIIAGVPVFVRGTARTG